MQKVIFFIVACFVTSQVSSQTNYWQQQVNYSINVSLNDKDHTIDGFESIEYINQSPDTLFFIWFHLWPNAYKNDRTAYSEQALKNRNTDFYFSKAEDRGYINRLDFKVNNETAQTAYDSINIDIMKLWLPEPLAPGKKATITTPFHVKLPYNFSRSGHIDNDYQITQWYPKPAVYDRKGWHTMPYVDQGEFYSEFGKYDVEITVPSAYIVASTGVLQDATTLEQIKRNGKHTVEGTKKSWHFVQDNIHDFAWFASKDFVVKYDSLQLPSKKNIDIFSFYKKDEKGWDKSIEYAAEGLKKYSEWIGDYPYNVMSVVQGESKKSVGGMEYPTITYISLNDSGQLLDATIVHEIGHNWFYGALASNERKHPWMDEGMNSFYQSRYENKKYGDFSYLDGVPNFLSKKLPADEEAWLLSIMTKIKKDQPIETPSENLRQINYLLSPYVKASLWMKTLEATLGKDLFDKSMKQYYSDWKFKHPYPEDFKKSIELSSGKNVDDLFNKLTQIGPLDSTKIKRVLKPTFLLNANNTKKYNYLNILPAIGYNNYDKLMFGAMVHNYQLPPNRFQFIAGGLVGTGSSSFNPFGRAGYTWRKSRSQVEAAISYASYTQNDFRLLDNSQLKMHMERIVPSVSLTLFDKDPTSTRKVTFSYKSFLIKEEQLQFKTVIVPPDTLDIFSKAGNNYYVNRLSMSISDDRKLFPYSLLVSADQGKGFVRASVTGKYFFNYADGKSGMSARIFAGKYFHTGNPSLLTRLLNQRYYLNMTGPVGREDYTNSNYFIGRNEFEGWMSQQIMERDGFFKIRTEAREIGISDNWLVALNLSTDVPEKINPLRVLPIKIPFKVFVDIGTYAEAWEDNSPTGKFIYDAGLQFSFFKSFINVYVPILYSKVYGDYIKSIVVEKKFLRTISFTIDIQKLELNKILRDIPL